MRRIAIIGLHALVMAAGLFIAFRPMITSGFTLLQTDPGDTLLNHYILEHTWKCLSDSHYPGSLWSPPCFYPEPNTLAYSENLLGSAPLYWLARLTLNELHAYQFWMLAVTALTYVSMAWTLRKFGVSHTLAALGSVVFAFGLPRISQLGHQQLLPLFYSPPAVYFAWRFLESPGTHALMAALAFVLLQIFASIYLGWFLVFGLAIFAALRLCWDRDARCRLVGFVFTKKYALTACVFVAALLLLPLLLPYWQANRGFHRHYSEVSTMLPTPRSWMSPAYGNWWRNWLPEYDGPMAHEHHNFSGIMFPLLLLAAIWTLLQRSIKSPGGATDCSHGWSAAQPVDQSALETIEPRRGDGFRRPSGAQPMMQTESTGSAALHPWLHSVAPPGLIEQRPESSNFTKTFAVCALLTAGVIVLISLKLGHFSAWRWVYAIIPGAKAIRAVTRIFTIVSLFAWLGALIIVDQRLRKWGRAGVAIAGLLLFLGTTEQVTTNQSTFDPQPFFAEVDRLSSQLHGASAAYIEPDPGSLFWTSQIVAMWAGLKADVPVVNGYSGRWPTGYPDIRIVMTPADVAAWTRRADIRYIGPVRLAAYYPAPPVVAGIDHRPYREESHAERTD